MSDSSKELWLAVILVVWCLSCAVFGYLVGCNDFKREAIKHGAGRYHGSISIEGETSRCWQWRSEDGWVTGEK